MLVTGKDIDLLVFVTNELAVNLAAGFNDSISERGCRHQDISGRAWRCQLHLHLHTYMSDSVLEPLALATNDDTLV